MSSSLLAALIPLIALQLLLAAAAMYDLIRREADRVAGPKAVWAIAILIFGFLGPIAYFLFGRKN